MRTLTLKNVPDPIHERLKERAQRNHRSLNREAIACLEAAIGPEPVDPETLLDRVRAFRRTLKIRLTPRMIDRAKRRGRP